MEDPRSFQIPRGIKEKLFITISFFFFNFYSKTSKRADTCLPQLGSFLLGFQSIPTAIKRCSYFKPYFTSVEVCHYQDFPVCPIAESLINFGPLNAQEWSIHGSACQHLCWTTSHAARQSQQGLVRKLGLCW